MADQGDVPQVEGVDDGREVVGVAVHVVAGRRLAGPTVSSSVVRDDAEALLREEQQLPVPGVGVQRPAVRERHYRALAPILVVDLRTVLGGDGAHGPDSFLQHRLCHFFRPPLPGLGGPRRKPGSVTRCAPGTTADRVGTLDARLPHPTPGETTRTRIPGIRAKPISSTLSLGDRVMLLRDRIASGYQAVSRAPAQLQVPTSGSGSHPVNGKIVRRREWAQVSFVSN